MQKDIAYQNKDVCFKILSENYKNKSLKVFGLDLPPIKRLLPTNLPALKLDEKRADNVFLLEDDSILLLEYESVTNIDDLFKYGHYGFRIIEKYFRGKYRKIIIVVIYTGDVESAQNELDMGSIYLKFEQVFLSKFDGNEIYTELKNKILNKEPMTDEDVMKFIILPLTEKKDKQELIEKTIDLAKKVDEKNKQTFIIAAILSVTNKFIDKDYAINVKEWISMTQVARLFEEEKIKAINETEARVRKEVLKEVWKEAEVVVKKVEEEAEARAKKAEAEAKKAEKALEQTVIRLLENNCEVAEIMSITGLNRSDIIAIKDKKSKTD